MLATVWRAKLKEAHKRSKSPNANPNKDIHDHNDHTWIYMAGIKEYDHMTPMDETTTSTVNFIPKP